MYIFETLLRIYVHNVRNWTLNQIELWPNVMYAWRPSQLMEVPTNGKLITEEKLVIA